MAEWTQLDFDNFYSPVDALVPPNHPLWGTTYSYGWNYYTYGSRRSLDGGSEELGFATAYNWVTALIDRASYAPGNKALVVGCGIGSLVYRIKKDFPVANVWGADNSTYIHSIKDIDAPAGFDTSLILNIDITSPDALNQLKPHTGGNGKVDWVICGLVTEIIPLVDRPAWYAACEALLAPNGNIAHIVVSDRGVSSMPQKWVDAGWTFQDIDTWQTEAPSHYWIDAADTTVFRIPV